MRLATNRLQWALYLHICIAVWAFGALDGAEVYYLKCYYFCGHCFSHVFSFCVAHTQIYVPFITEIYRNNAKLLQPGDRPSFLLMLTQRLQRLPAILPFGALLLLAGRDVIVLVLGPAYHSAVEAYKRRQRQLERLRLLKLRKQALPFP